MAPRIIFLLAGLGGAVALYVASRTRAGSAAAVDAIVGLVDVSTRIGKALESRGYRNKNPGNIRYIVNNPWNGQLADDNGYAVYDTPANGTRALGKELLKRRAQGFRTVRDLIAGKPASNGNRAGGWAPPNENDTEAYVRDLANFLGVDPDAPIDIDLRLGDLARGIARHENGYLDGAYNFDAWVRL